MVKTTERFDDAWDESRDDLVGFSDIHFSTLYDQDEDESGEKYDLATGLHYDNSADVAENLGMYVFDPTQESEDEFEGDLTPEELKEIDYWLKVGEGLAHAAETAELIHPKSLNNDAA